MRHFGGEICGNSAERFAVFRRRDLRSPPSFRIFLYFGKRKTCGIRGGQPSEVQEAALLHKASDFSVVALLIAGDEKLSEIRHLFFRNNHQASALRDKVMIRKNDGRALVAVVEDLRLHAVKTQLYCLFIRRGGLPYYAFYALLDNRFYGKRRDI